MDGAQSVLSIALTHQIVVAYLARNQLPADGVAGLLVSVHTALAEVERRLKGADAAGPSLPTQDEVRRSITPEALVSFEDGRPYKLLTRHLARRGLTPAAYRAKWGLPFDYPMTAPRLSAIRTAVAKSMGLGRRAAPDVKLPSPPTTEAMLESAISKPSRSRLARPTDLAT